MLGMYEADICQKIEHTQAETKKHYSYKKACRAIKTSTLG